MAGWWEKAGIPAGGNSLMSNLLACQKPAMFNGQKYIKALNAIYLVIHHPENFMTVLRKPNLGRLLLSLALLTALTSVVTAQTTMPTIPKAPAVSDVPSIPTVPAMPSKSSIPAVPAMPSKSSIPSVPTKPSMPAMPSVPSTQSLPSLPTAAPIKTTPPTTAGKWVPRIDKKTCPKGSTAYLADDGGVKCWVNDA